MITSGCIKMKWTDSFLKWQPDQYGNLTWLALPSSDLWLPDVAMVNSPDPYYITRKAAFTAITSNGDVGYYPTGRFSTQCNIKLSYFPFDFQHCDVVFESWIYPFTLLNLEPMNEAIDLGEFHENHQWDLVKYAISSTNVTYDGLEFSHVVFRFYFQRKILYYGILVIFPCTLMSLVQAFTHTLPVEHPARVIVLTAIFISSMFLQGSLASQMPKSSDGVTLVRKSPHP